MRVEDVDWAAYNDHQVDREVRPLCRNVIALAGNGAGRAAIDFGCGAGVETRALLEAGWSVHALDTAHNTSARVLKTTAGVGQERLTIDVEDFHGRIALPPTDLFYAGYALPFVHPDKFPEVWTVIRNSLRPGAWVAVDLFGERDAWAGSPNMTFLTELGARTLFDGLEVLRLTEEDQDGPAYSGPKHWHIFRVIARQPALRLHGSGLV
jgi:trans-aconitate methyltransferase